MVQNFGVYFEVIREALRGDIRELRSHVGTFYAAIPASIIKKLVMDILTTAQKRHQDNCAKVHLEYRKSLIISLPAFMSSRFYGLNTVLSLI